MEKMCQRYRHNLVEIRRYKRLSQFSKVRALQGEQKRLRVKIESYIKSQDDAVISLLLYERFVRGRSWQSVANILGGNNTADGVRMKVSRHFRQN